MVNTLESARFTTPVPSPHMPLLLYRKIHYSAQDFEARVVESSNFTMATEVANYRLAMAVDVL
jgi:hypothetical protein